MSAINYEFREIVANEKWIIKMQCHGVDPSTGKQLWSAPLAVEQNLDEAVESGRRAFKKRSPRTHDERCQLVLDRQQ